MNASRDINACSLVLDIACPSLLVLLGAISAPKIWNSFPLLSVSHRRSLFSEAVYTERTFFFPVSLLDRIATSYPGPYLRGGSGINPPPENF